MKNDYNPPILSLESENRYTDPSKNFKVTQSLKF